MMKKKTTKKRNKTERFSTKKKKEIFLKSYGDSLGHITISCKKAKIGRTTYYDWIEKDPEFKQQLHDSVEELKDTIENELVSFALARDKGSVAALIFLAKTKLRDRGYIEKQEVQVSGGVTEFIKSWQDTYDDITNTGASKPTPKGKKDKGADKKTI